MTENKITLSQKTDIELLLMNIRNARAAARHCMISRELYVAIINIEQAEMWMEKFLREHPVEN
jgi:hypothetical protein